MNTLAASFTPREWAVAFVWCLAVMVFLATVVAYLNSRWWRQSVTNKEGIAVAGDIQKHASWMLACALIIAVAVGKIVYERDAGEALPTLIVALLSYSGVLQNNKRLTLKDAMDAAKPSAPGTYVDATNANVGVGPNTST